MMLLHCDAPGRYLVRRCQPLAARLPYPRRLPPLRIALGLAAVAAMLCGTTSAIRPLEAQEQPAKPQAASPAAGPTAAAPDTVTANEAAQAARLADAEVAQWKIRSVGDSKDFDRPARSLLGWSNPTIGRVYGSVYAFTRQGRPAAVMSVYKWYAPYTTLTAEVVSLSTVPLSATRDGAKAWEPRVPGVAWSPTPGAPLPSAQKPARLQQMKSLAKEFVPELADRRVDVAGEPQLPRLLTQPVLRYEPQDGQGTDGGLFAYVIGTDPELWLLLEARPHAGQLRWEYAIVRMNRDPLQVRHRETVVWKVDAVDGISGIRDPYCQINIAP